jgi:ribose transport system substrate-binding protein
VLNVKGRLFVVGTLLGTFAIALSGCSNSGTTGSGSAAQTSGNKAEKVSIAFFSAAATNTFNDANYKGAKEAADKIGAQITIFSAEFDPNKQINQVQDAIVSGKYNLFIINPLNAPGLAAPAKAALDKGIAVVSILGSIGPNLDSLDSSVKGVITIGQTFSVNGENLAKYMVQACGNKNPCRVAYMPGDPKQATERIRVEAVNAYLKKYPQVNLVAEQAGGFDARTGLTTATNILTAHPDLDVIGSSAGQSIAGALKAIKAAGLDGKIKVISNGATTQDVDGIRSGAIFASPVYLPFTEGRLAVEYGVKALKGEKVSTAINETQFSPVGEVATKENLNSPEGKSFTGEYSAF